MLRAGVQLATPGAGLIIGCFIFFEGCRPGAGGSAGSQAREPQLLAELWNPYNPSWPGRAEEGDGSGSHSAAAAIAMQRNAPQFALLVPLCKFQG